MRSSPRRGWREGLGSGSGLGLGLGLGSGLGLGLGFRLARLVEDGELRLVDEQPREGEALQVRARG